MRVLITVDPEIPVPPLTYGGIERIVDQLVGGLRSRGHKVGLSAHPASTAAADAFFPWPGGRSQSSADTVHNLLSLGRAIGDFQPDVVHSFSRLAYLFPHLWAKRPLLMSYQREPTARTVRVAASLARKGTLTFTGCSRYIAARGRRHAGQWEAIPNFVDPSRLPFQPTVTADAPLVFLSRVETIKGADLAIEIARRCGRRLVIAGNHAESGKEGEYWRDRIAPFVDRDGVEYVGPVDDEQKARLLGQASALLVPVQWSEPFGIVFAEALACGTPVISCPRGALPEIVRDGLEGFLVETVEDGCRAVGRLAEIDRGACRRRAEEEFSAPVIVGRYEALYDRVVRAMGEGR
jgi:glycosyltransferase involved in cell wall biosynthesis